MSSRRLALWVALVALAVPVPAAAAAPADDLAANPGALERVPDRFRPLFRWWWPGDTVDAAELRAELRGVKAAGFAGVEQILLTNTKQWGTPAFRQRTRIALQEAQRLGLRLDITLGPGWPVSSPSVEDLNREASVQDLHYGAVDLQGGTTYSGPVPDRPPPGADRRRLIAATAMRIARDGSPQVLDPASAVDLTSTVRDGALTWAVPGGRWKLFGFWMRPSLMPSKAPGGGPDGWLVVDHFSRSAIELVLRDFDRMLFGGDMAALLRRGAGDVFEDSLEVEHGPAAEGQSAVFWSPALLREFARRRGYALTRLLPGIFEEFTFPGNAGERLKGDFDRTLNDLLIANHLRPIRRWANRKGLRSRGQAYQAGAGELGLTENNRLAAALQNPDVETLGFGDPTIGTLAAVGPGSADARTVLDRYRQVVSGAHLSGAKEITNEWGAVLDGQFRIGLHDLRAFADRSLAAGVSRMMLHAFSYRTYAEPPGSSRRTPPWPGWCAYCGGPLEFSDSWKQRWPAFKALPALAEYVGRAGAAVRTGRPRVDLTLLNATSRVAGIGVTPPAPGSPEDRLRETLQGAGFTWDAMDPLSLPQAGGASGHRLLPKGPAYEALVVNDLAAMPGPSARRLTQLARDGLPVIVYGRVPQEGAGFKDASSEDSAVQAAVRRLRGLGNVRFATSTAALVRALHALGIEPDLAQGGSATIVPVHRRTPTGDVWFLFNDSTRQLTRNLRFATRGAPARLDLWTGEVTRLAHYTERGGRVTVPVTLGPARTAVVTFARRRAGGPSVRSTTADAALVRGSRVVLRDLKGGRQTAVRRDGRRVGVKLPTLPGPRTVMGPWRLVATTVAPEGDARVERTLPALADWRDIPGLESKSGTGTYTATVELPAAWMGGGRGVLLDPGDFGGALRVWVNGRLSSGAAVPGEEPRDVTPLLRPGRNTLRLEVSTTLNNAMRAHAQLGDPNYVSYVGRPLQRAGLSGPVRLVPYAQAAVRAAG